MNKSTRSRCYISGKISGLTYGTIDRNFARARHQVFKMGYMPVSPWPSAIPEWMPWICHMILDIAVLLTCETIALMPNHSTSRGCRIEKGLAEFFKKTIIYLEGNDY